MKKLFAIALMFCLTSLTAYADINSYNVDYDYENNKIIVKVNLTEAGATKDLTLGVLEEVYDFSEPLSDGSVKTAVEYVEQIRIEENQTEAVFNVAMTGDSRNLNAGLFGNGISNPKFFDLKYVKNAQFVSTLNLLKQNIASRDVFVAFLDNIELGNPEKNEFYLNCDVIKGGVQKDLVRGIMYESFKKSASEITKLEDVEKMWSQSNLIALVNSGLVSDITVYSDVVNLSGGKIQEWYGKVSTQSNSAAKLTQTLTKTQYVDTQSFEKALKEALVLTVTKYPDGADNIGTILNDFSDVTGITQTGETKIYLQLAGKDFTNLESFKTSYNQLKNSNDTPTASSGNGGGGGGGFSPIILSPTNKEQMDNAPGNNTVNMSYEDLDTVTWAYEAISVLSDMGILNGRTETRFAPDDSVKREEFVKILICALGIENEEYNINFNDAGEDKWYSKYVNIAYEKGICNGIDTVNFGAGQNITRQDMATLLYRALLYKNFAGKNDEVSFDDANEISDYAKDAVNALVNHGAIAGVGNNKFDPLGIATRAQAAKMVFGVIDVLR